MEYLNKKFICIGRHSSQDVQMWGYANKEIMSKIVQGQSLSWYLSAMLNSRCCCKETPPMAGWNLEIFTALYRKSGMLFHEKILSVLFTHNKHLLHETCASIASGQAYAVRSGLHEVSRAYINYYMTEFSWKQLCWFSGWCAGKNYQDFIQPVAAFCNSNIWY